jgi:hypothetical protein
VIGIARKAGIRAEIYHLKAAGEENWPKLSQVIARVNEARASGLAITADMYTYTAAATGLDAAMPPWVQEGGYLRWAERLRNPRIRARVKREMNRPTDNWENFYRFAGPEGILLVGFKADSLKQYTGKSLAEVARLRSSTPEETAMDLVARDGSRVETVYFLMSEDNLRKQIPLPWLSFGSDAEASAPEGVFLKSNPHPRAYGNFARLLGRYVREERLIPLEEAIRRLTSLPAENLRISRRGKLAPGYFADIAVFDPARIADHATFERPHQYATGMVHVLVNGVPVLRNGEHTGAKPGRVVRGPGWRGRSLVTGYSEIQIPRLEFTRSGGVTPERRGGFAPARQAQQIRGALVHRIRLSPRLGARCGEIQPGERLLVRVAFYGRIRSCERVAVGQGLFAAQVGVAGNLAVRHYAPGVRGAEQPEHEGDAAMYLSPSRDGEAVPDHPRDHRVRGAVHGFALRHEVPLDQAISKSGGAQP